MKFVVNRVSKESSHSESDMQGRTVDIDDMVVEQNSKYYLYGWSSGYLKNKTYVGGFTVSEVPDTEEGYYLL